MNDYDETTLKHLRKLVNALDALSSSTREAFHTGMATPRTVQAMAATYDKLAEKVQDLLAEPDPVVEALIIDVDIDEDEDIQEQLGQLHYAVNQLHAYLRQQLKAAAREQRRSTRSEDWSDWAEQIGDDVGEDWRDMADMGRQLQQQILAKTRSALRRALSNMDADIDIDINDEGIHVNKKKTAARPDSKTKVDIDISDDDAPHGDFPNPDDDDVRLV